LIVPDFDARHEEKAPRLPAPHLRVIMPDDIERIHGEVVKFERIQAISDPMRELIEDLWPELVHKLPPKNPQG
jgi:hypothetical protein